MDAVEEIKSRLAVEDVVADYVQLKRSGRNLKGLSPFQAEKSPSFMVSPEKGIWHDFSSNKGGNMFSFIMEMEGVDFRGALEILARKAGVELEAYGKSRSNSKLKERLADALDLATKYFQKPGFARVFGWKARIYQRNNLKLPAWLRTAGRRWARQRAHEKGIHRRRNHQSRTRCTALPGA